MNFRQVHQEKKDLKKQSLPDLLARFEQLLNDAISNAAHAISFSLDRLCVLSTIAVVIRLKHQHLTRLHQGIDWTSLSMLAEAINKAEQDSFYENRWPMLQIAVRELAHSQEAGGSGELPALLESIQRIRTIPGYTVTTPLLPRLKVMTEFLITNMQLYTLTKEINQSDLDNISMDNPDHRLHALLTTARIGEAILSLSPLARKHFPKNIIDGLKRMRLVFFHPELANNWTLIKDVHLSHCCSGDLDARFISQVFDTIVQSHRQAITEYDTLAGRKEIMMDNELHNAQGNIPIPIQLWRELTINIPAIAPLPVPPEPFEMVQQGYKAWNGRYLRPYERDLLIDVVDNHRQAYQYAVALQRAEMLAEATDSGEISDLKEVNHFVTAYEGLLAIHKKALYEDFLYNRQHTDDEIDHMVQQNHVIPKQQAKQFKSECIKWLTTPPDTSKDLREWSHHRRALVLAELIKLRAILNSQQGALKKYKSDYEHELLLQQQSGTVLPKSNEKGSILYDYPSLLAKYEAYDKQKNQTRMNFHQIDQEHRTRWKQIELREATKVIPQIIYSLEQIISYTVDYTPRQLFMNLGQYYGPSIREFYQMVAGSLVRSLLDDRIKRKQNDTFVDAARIAVTVINKTEFSLHDLLKKMQGFRGLIAHVDQNFPGSCKMEKTLVERVFSVNKYATSAITLLLNIQQQFTQELNAQ